MVEEDPVELQQRARALRDRHDHLLLATADARGEPQIGTVPYLLDEDDAFCIYVSELAAHTRNLMVRPRTSVLFAQPEAEMRNPFARRRLVLQCRAQRLDGAAAERRLERMEARFGQTLGLLRRLPDFHLFRLEVESGRYVEGFGRAWTVRGNELRIDGSSGG